MAKILAYRGAGSIFGAAQAWLKGSDGQPREFPTIAEAEAEAARLNAASGPNVSYVAKGGE